MKDNKVYLILIVILGFVGYNMFTMRDIRTNVESFNQKIDSIQNDIDSIALVNSELDNKIESLHSEIELIDGDISRVQNNIYTIKQNTDEKVNNVDVLTFNELVEFFSNRYSNRLDSKTGSSDSKAGN